MPEKKIKKLFQRVGHTTSPTMPPVKTKTPIAQEKPDFGAADKLKLFKKRALETQKLRDTLRYSNEILQYMKKNGGVDQVTRPSWQRENPFTWGVCKANLFTWIVLMTHQKQNRGNKNWSFIFYELMTQGSTIKRDCLSYKHIPEYHNLLVNTLDIYHPELREYAEELCRFFECHYIDPYSCVIGQNPSNKILQASLFVNETKLKEYSPFQSVDISEPNNITQKKYVEILSRIIHWATFEAEKALQSLKETAAKIRNVEEYPRGSLVLVQQREKSGTKGGKWIYGRVAAPAEGSLMRVYITPDEEMVTNVEPEKVILVAENCMQYFTSEDCFEMEKCVIHPTDIALGKIKKYCNSRARQYLQEHNIEENIIQEVMTKKYTLKQITQLEFAVEFCDKLVDQTYVHGTTHIAREMIENTIKKIHEAPIHENFQLTLQKNITKLKEFNCELEFLKEYNKFKEAFKNALENMEAEKESILSGRRKKQVSDTWLSNIDTSVRDFLSKHGFEAGAIPHNYLDEPPNNLRTVRRNTVLLRRILKSYDNGTDNFKVKELISRLCETSYETIGQFVDTIDLCMSLYLGISVSKLPSHSKLLEEIEATPLDDPVKKQLSDLAKDKQYLTAMKRMETDEEFAKTQRMQTVPISGLVMSKLCRIENEHKTAIALWEPIVKISSAEDFADTLEGAILNNNLIRIKEFMAQGTKYVNEADPNGVTPLHLSCSYSGNVARLEITKYFLEFPEIDIILANFWGDTPFHYFVRIQVSSGQASLYRNLLEKFIEKNQQLLGAQNHKGETALHHAVLFSNETSVHFLLEKGASADTPTEQGETPVHYAVASGNLGCLKLLMENSANHFTLDSDGNSPLDIAIKLNRTEIIEFLDKYQYQSLLVRSCSPRSQILQRFGTLEETIGADVMNMVCERSEAVRSRRKKRPRGMTVDTAGPTHNSTPTTQLTRNKTTKERMRVPSLYNKPPT